MNLKLFSTKKKYDINFGLNDTICALKFHMADIINVPNTMQKVMFKGLAKDKMSLRQVGVVKGSKVMVVGSTLSDVLEMAKKPSAQEVKEAAQEEAVKETWAAQTAHKKVLDKGKPEDAMPGIKNMNENLSMVPLAGMLNKTGGKVMLISKLELDQVWLGI